MIADETKCSYDPGVWNGPFIFIPETKEQFLEVKDLLVEFNLKHSWAN